MTDDEPLKDTLNRDEGPEKKPKATSLDSLLVVIPSKVRFLIIGFILITASLACWFFWGSITIKVQGQGITFHVPCKEDTSRENCGQYVNAFFPFQKAQNIMPGQTGEAKFYSYQLKEKGKLFLEVVSIDPTPSSIKEAASFFKSEGIAKLLVGDNVVVRVVLKAKQDPRNPSMFIWGKETNPILEDGVVCTVGVIIKKASPISYFQQ